MSVGTNTAVGMVTIGGGGIQDFFGAATADLTLEAFGLDRVGTGGSSLYQPQVLAQPAASNTVAIGGIGPDEYVPSTRASIGANGQLVLGGGGGTMPTAGAQAATGAGTAAPARQTLSRRQELQIEMGKPIVEWRVALWGEGQTLQMYAESVNATVEEIMKWNPNAGPGKELLLPVHGDGPAVTGGGPGGNDIPDWVQDRLAQNGVNVGVSGGGATQQSYVPAQPPAPASQVTVPVDSAVAPASGPAAAPQSGSYSLPQLQTLLTTLTQFRDSQMTDHSGHQM